MISPFPSVNDSVDLLKFDTHLQYEQYFGNINVFIKNYLLSETIAKSTVFEPRYAILDNEKEIQEYIDSSLQLDQPLQKFTLSEMHSNIIHDLPNLLTNIGTENV